MQRFKTSWIVLGITALVMLILIFSFVGSYNNLITTGENIDGKWSQVENNLQRRADLIPNLVETVKGYATHERELLDRVTQARASAMSAQGIKEKAGAENMLSDTLKSLFAVSENYPDLKASQNFLELQRELTDTEDKIQAARRFYNTNVRDLNIKIESFPDNVIANMFGFKQMEMFQTASEAERQPVNVKF